MKPKPACYPTLSYVVGRVDRALRRQLGAGLNQIGLTIPQYTALSVLNARSGLSNAQLARRSLITPQSALKLIAALERDGLVTRAPDPDHGRILRTVLTPRGKHVLAECDQVARAVESEMLSQLSGAERERLLADLKSCARGLGAGFVDI
jgi:DNA-binding MarR family transcriptional regulator